MCTTPCSRMSPGSHAPVAIRAGCTCDPDAFEITWVSHYLHVTCAGWLHTQQGTKHLLDPGMLLGAQGCHPRHQLCLDEKIHSHQAARHALEPPEAWDCRWPVGGHGMSYLPPIHAVHRLCDVRGVWFAHPTLRENDENDAMGISQHGVLASAAKTLYDDSRGRSHVLL